MCRWETGAQGGEGLAQDRTEPEPGPRFPVRPALPFCSCDRLPLHLGLPCPSPATVCLSALRTDGLGRPLCPGAPGEGADLTAWPKGQCWPAVFPAPAGLEEASPCARTWSPKERVRLFPWPPVSREKQDSGSVAGRRGSPAARGCPGSRWLIWSNVLLTSHSQIPPRAPVPGTSPPALLFPRCLFPATVHSFPLPPAPTLPSHFLRVTQRPRHTLFQLCGHTHSQSHTPRAPASLLPNKEPFLTQASSPRPSPSFCSCFYKLAGHAVQFPWVSGSVRRGVGVTCVGTDSAARCAGLQLPGSLRKGVGGAGGLLI